MAQKWTVTTNDRDVAQRLARCDDAYHVLWEISYRLRGHYKYGADLEETLAQIRDEIDTSNLLDLWT